MGCKTNKLNVCRILGTTFKAIKVTIDALEKGDKLEYNVTLGSLFVLRENPVINGKEAVITLSELEAISTAGRSYTHALYWVHNGVRRLVFEGNLDIVEHGSENDTGSGNGTFKLVDENLEVKVDYNEVVIGGSFTNLVNGEPIRVAIGTGEQVKGLDANLVITQGADGMAKNVVYNGVLLYGTIEKPTEDTGDAVQVDLNKDSFVFTARQYVRIMATMRSEYLVDWGDGTTERVKEMAVHYYNNTDKEYTVIVNTATVFEPSLIEGMERLLQFGSVSLGYGYFLYNAKSIEDTPKPQDSMDYLFMTPNLQSTTITSLKLTGSCSNMFQDSAYRWDTVQNWDVSEAVDFSFALQNTQFAADISQWDFYPNCLFDGFIKNAPNLTPDIIDRLLVKLSTKDWSGRYQRKSIDIEANCTQVGLDAAQVLIDNGWSVFGLRLA